MSKFLRLLAGARTPLWLALTITIFAAIATLAPLIDESKLKSLTGRVVRQVSSDGFTLYIQPQGGNEPTQVRVRNNRLPKRKRPEMLSENVQVRFAKPDDVIALTVNGRDYMTVAETIEQERLSRQETQQFVSISAPIVIILLVGSFWAKRKL